MTEATAGKTWNGVPEELRVWEGTPLTCLAPGTIFKNPWLTLCAEASTIALLCVQAVRLHKEHSQEIDRYQMESSQAE